MHGEYKLQYLQKQTSNIVFYHDLFPRLHVFILIRRIPSRSWVKAVL